MSEKAKQAKKDIAINLYFLLLSSVIVLIGNILADLNSDYDSGFLFFILICVYTAYCLFIGYLLKSSCVEQLNEKS